MHHPILQQHPTGVVGIVRACVIAPADGAARRGPVQDWIGTRTPQLPQKTASVGGMDHIVLIAVKYNHGRRASGPAGAVGANTIAHGRNRRAQRRDIAARQTRMDAGRNIDVRVSRREDCRRRSPCRYARNVDTRRIGFARGQDLAGQACDQGRFAAAALLVARAMPVPAAPEIGDRRLLGIQHQKAQLVGKRVHAAANREVSRRLLAAMQHDNKRQLAAW